MRDERADSSVSGTGEAVAMKYDLLYTEGHVEKALQNHRFLAAVEAYSMNMFPLGEAFSRAGALYQKGDKQKTRLDPLGYLQLIHDLAERIVDHSLSIPKNLREQYPEIYDSKLQHYIPTKNDGARPLLFSELQNPEVKRRALILYRRSFHENDIVTITKDERILAGIDAWRSSLLTFGQLQQKWFGEPYHNGAFNLTFDAFHNLCLEVARRMESGAIDVPPDLKVKFPEFYKQEL